MGVAFCIRCPVGSSGAVPSITWAGCCRNVPCVGYVCPSIVIESPLLLACLCMGSTLRLPDWEAQLQPLHVSWCARADHSKKNFPQQDLVPAQIFFWMCCLWSFQILLWCCLKMAPGCVGSGPLGRNFGVDQCKMLPVSAPRELICSDSICGASAAPGCVHPKVCFCQHWAQGKVNKNLKAT